MLIKKIHAVQKILNNADEHANKFALKNNIFCELGCGKCCEDINVEATILEFMPAAYYLFKQNRITDLYNKIETLEQKSICIFYALMNNKFGSCDIYNYRGLICRLFGYSTHINKNGNLNLVTCNLIKSLPTYQKITTKELQKAPKITNYYSKLSSIDFKLGIEQYPINSAIKKAMEIVMFYFQFKGKRSA